jgi:hypothetical protein
MLETENDKAYLDGYRPEDEEESRYYREAPFYVITAELEDPYWVKL